MIVKLLGVFDIIAATFLVIGTRFSETVLLYVAVYLLIKGLLFSFTGDMASITDVVIGLYAWGITLGFSWIVFTVIFALFLYGKGIMSFA
ncbi:hypothetical protein JXB27_04780 [Candidatus Woesearchaeota archaeon]|nr:hypothetical protein [Candidatus Woesearchaeota archaeon]